MRKGIILAGGKGTRLYPLTRVVSKQLLHVYDKPMVYYPLSILMLANIRDILIISTPHDLPHYQELLGNGTDLGLNLSYQEQLAPRGLPEAFILGEDFLQGSPSALILGDNIFFGIGLPPLLENISENVGMGVFSYPVSDPREYGVVEVNTDNQIISIEEKPKIPKSNLALTGLYFCDNQAPTLAKALKPSPRGEFEIIDLMREYQKRGQLNMYPIGRGAAWLDTGNPDSLLDASNFIATIERRQGLKIACLEEIAYNKEWINRSQLIKLAEDQKNSYYGKYLSSLLG
ncbi:MAG: glucose-1-phosphate thymidylyltransferase RfbA [Alphaproteobacteria bacterium]|nr:glucose-1-phosphate thymidylyltransferase RfbA [Alphaproteobacteria bacterium]